ncbi:MAG: hypothetical protein KIT68_07645 [Phycisphaeraceae bacterium]|nr:hypothetical protein [Phycisphaeraceae bacterium]
MERQVIELCLLVVASVIGALVMARVLRLDRLVARALTRHAALPAPHEAVATVVRLAEAASRQGMGALGSAVGRAPDALTQRGLGLIESRTEPELLRRDLHRSLDMMLAMRPGRMGRLTSQAMATIGLGSLAVALALVLRHADDPTTISAGVALAVLSLVVAGGVFHQLSRPFADAFHATRAQEMLAGLILIEGLLAIRQGGDAAMVRERVAELLPPNVDLSGGVRAAA